MRWNLTMVSADEELSIDLNSLGKGLPEVC